MPHTPDFLGNMDDSMDCISGMYINRNKYIHPFFQPIIFFLFQPNFPESGTMESMSANLDATDDLVPSLQQVISPFPKTKNLIFSEKAEND